jgi:hypothetical protein
MMLKKSAENSRFIQNQLNFTRHSALDAESRKFTRFPLSLASLELWRSGRE